MNTVYEADLDEIAEYLEDGERVQLSPSQGADLVEFLRQQSEGGAGRQREDAATMLCFLEREGGAE